MTKQETINGAKLIVKHFNTSVAQHFYPIKISTTWNALPYEVVSRRTVNSFKNSFDKHWLENPPNVRVNCNGIAIIDAVRNLSAHSRRPAFYWKWTQRCVIRLLLLLLQLLLLLRLLLLLLVLLVLERPPVNTCGRQQHSNTW